MPKQSLEPHNSMQLAVPRAVGRPTVYTDEVAENIAEAMAEGLSLECAAVACGVGPRTVFTWQNQHEEFRRAVEEGRARSLLFWERRAIAMSKGEAGNASIVSLGLKNRSRAASGWHDTNKLEVSGPNNGPVQHQLPPDFDLRRLDDRELAQFEALLLKACPQLVNKAD